jgi:DNA-binding MarR family transcriptional regulator
VYTVAQEQRALAALMDFEHALLEEERDLRTTLHRRSVVLSPTMAEDSPARAALTASRRRREAMVEMLSPAEREAMAAALSQLADSLAGRRSDALSG